MKVDMIETARLDLAEALTATDHVLHLGAADDPLWAGVVTLAPSSEYARLSSSGRRLTLVAWEPDTHTRDHGHRNGEEILVLSGELRSHDQRYPAGTWIRLHPGVRHDPFTEIPTVIMLRNGHLEATPST
ncbi:MAG: cupin domain-containing protein [Paraburkholderia sp.]|uniref:cupin domain-containing protein n=1 Tax=Paraburkholderia sp. TaxID=1926495 RepID=UPI003C51F8C9